MASPGLARGQEGAIPAWNVPLPQQGADPGGGPRALPGCVAAVRSWDRRDSLKAAVPRPELIAACPGSSLVSLVLHELMEMPGLIAVHPYDDMKLLVYA